VTRLADASTEAVLGAAALLAALEPDAAQARELARDLRCYTPADRDEWMGEIAACQAAERWIEAHQAAHQAVRDALTQLPALDAPARRLMAGEPLAEGELFVVKRFLYFGASVAKNANSLLAAWQADAAAWPAWMAELMMRLHPEPAPSARFHLSAELDPALATLRAQVQDARRALRELRTQREAALRQDYGVAFDFEGALRLPPALAGRAASDPRLRQRHAAWELQDAEVDEAAALLAQREAACRDVEGALLARLSDMLRDALDALLTISQALIALDLRLARARLRARMGGCWPQWRDAGDGAVMRAALDPRLRARNPNAQPIDLELDQRPVVITGPNMGGKSSALKLFGLCQWAMQHALPAPAAEFAAPPVAQIVYVGSDEPHAEQAAPGLSSFGREVQRLVSCIAQAPAPRLWLLDEIGRGTHPDEGAALARAVIAKLAQAPDRALAVTHFPAVAALPGAARWRVEGIDRAAVRALLPDAADAEALARALSRAMSYRLLPAQDGDEDVPRDALLVAELLGLSL
jgi:DNA mismatch repair ATPase MutS